MFEAADAVENMWKVFDVFRKPISAIQDPNFTLGDHPVRLFLGGDFHFLDDCLGHHGSASKYPSSTDLVALDHLRNHGGRPHTPHNCDIEMRTVEHYVTSYNENLCDDRDNGKHHYNVCEQMLIPIQDLVPPVLHIMLGITLLLYNSLLQFCQQLGKEESESSTDEAEQKEKVIQEWEENSLVRKIPQTRGAWVRCG